jgi:cholesterol transport system auxiliary component
MNKSTPVEVRYFTPEAVDVRVASAETRDATAKLRLGRVGSSRYLRSRIVYRHAASELAEYDDRRWTEDPEAYLRRSLARALFEDHRVVQAVGGPAPVLDVELVTFEELRRGSARFGRVELTYVLHDDRDVLASGRVSTERPAASSEMSDVVAAISAALEATTSEVATVVTTRLGGR